MGHDLATGLIPILVEAIASHCLVADQQAEPTAVMAKSSSP